MHSFETSSDRHDYRHDKVMYCFILSAVFSLIRPYKKQIHNLVEILLLNLTVVMVWYTMESQSIQKTNCLIHETGHAIIAVLVMLAPHLILACMITYRAFHLLQHSFQLSHNCTCRLMKKLHWMKVALSKLTKGSDEGHTLTQTAADLHTVESYGTM